MLRRSFLTYSAAAAFAQQPRRPNIVIIYADDLGYGDLGCYGHPVNRTPNLDRMASEGVRFTQFYSAAATCSPSRAALLTGRLPIRSGLTRVLSPFSTGGVPDSEILLSEALKTVGYATGIVGKWHLGWQKQFLPTRHGFDHYFGIPYSNDMSPPTNPNPRWQTAPPTPLLRGESVIEREPDQTQITRRYTEEATGWLRVQARSRRPFFLYLPHTMVHTPLHASQRFRGASGRGLFGDALEELDWSVGEVLRAIREEGAEDNTLVMFSSDNGPWLIQKQAGGSAGLLREGKASTWEGGVREPFIARWPGRIPAGVVSHAFGSTMDIFPTCLKLAGAAAPAGRVFDGEDLGPALFEKREDREPLMFLYGDTEVQAVRKGPWKLHLATQSPESNRPQAEKHDPPLLFHLLHDPSEKYNVADSHPEVVRDLTALAARHKAEMKPGQLQR
jgi:arylsulfatase A-like enzyme